MSLDAMDAFLAFFHTRYKTASVAAVRVFILIAGFDGITGRHRLHLMQIAETLNIPPHTVTRIVQALGPGSCPIGPSRGLGLVRVEVSAGRKRPVLTPRGKRLASLLSQHALIGRTTSPAA